jgi:hypothetical protein
LDVELPFRHINNRQSSIINLSRHSREATADRQSKGVLDLTPSTYVANFNRITGEW